MDAPEKFEDTMWYSIAVSSLVYFLNGILVCLGL